jgi:hypothetical protein
MFLLGRTVEGTLSLIFFRWWLTGRHSALNRNHAGSIPVQRTRRFKIDPVLTFTTGLVVCVVIIVLCVAFGGTER